MALVDLLDFDMDEKKAHKSIEAATVLGFFVGSITLVLTLISIFGKSVLGFSIYNILDAGIIYALSYGIYKHNRIAAAIMVVYYVANQVLLFIEGYHKSLSIIISLIFFLIFLRGAIGAFIYHGYRFRKKK